MIPKYTHVGEPQDTFLGTFNEMDMYFRPHKNGRDVCLIRCSSASYDYWTEAYASAAEGHAMSVVLQIAALLVKDMKLADPKNRQALLHR